jgi:hypothetical protein
MSANPFAGSRIKGHSAVTPERGYIAVTPNLRLPASKGLFLGGHVNGSASPLEIVVPARYFPVGSGSAHTFVFPQPLPIVFRY